MGVVGRHANASAASDGSVADATCAHQERGAIASKSDSTRQKRQIEHAGSNRQASANRQDFRSRKTLPTDGTRRQLLDAWNLRLQHADSNRLKHGLHRFELATLSLIQPNERRRRRPEAADFRLDE